MRKNQGSDGKQENRKRTKRGDSETKIQRVKKQRLLIFLTYNIKDAYLDKDDPQMGILAAGTFTI